MTATHLGILQDIRRRGFYKLEECGVWLCDHLVEIIMLDGPPLITINDDYIVTLTSKGWEITAEDSLTCGMKLKTPTAPTAPHPQVQ